MDLTREFYRYLASGKGNIPDPVKLPEVGTLAEFEATLSEVENMSDSQCRIMLIEALKLILTQQKMLQDLMKKQLGL